MFRQVLKYGAFLTGAYLLLAHATDGGKLISTGGGTLDSVVKTFQGR